jgi:hypothetical protein
MNTKPTCPLLVTALVWTVFTGESRLQTPTLENLQDAVAGTAAAFRLTLKLEAVSP